MNSDQLMHRIQVINDEEEDDQHISEQQRKEFAQLIDKFKTVFSTRPGKIKEYQCRIKIREGEPIHQRPYPVPMSKITRMDAEIQRMLNWEIIEKSNSPWSSPIVGIEKKTETFAYV